MTEYKRGKLDEKPMEAPTNLYRERMRDQELRRQFAGDPDKKKRLTRLKMRCPLQDEKRNCKPSYEVERLGEIYPFYCTALDYYETCPIYREHGRV